MRRDYKAMAERRDHIVYRYIIPVISTITGILGILTCYVALSK